MNIQLNDNNCRINFKDMVMSTNPPSLEQALLEVEPFELSQDVLDGKTKIQVEVERSLFKNVCQGWYNTCGKL